MLAMMVIYQKYSNTEMKLYEKLHSYFCNIFRLILKTVQFLFIRHPPGIGQDPPLFLQELFDIIFY